MEEEEMNELVSKLTHKELLCLKMCVDHEIRMSERAIAEGFEKEE